VKYLRYGSKTKKHIEKDAYVNAETKIEQNRNAKGYKDTKRLRK